MRVHSCRPYCIGARGVRGAGGLGGIISARDRRGG